VCDFNGPPYQFKLVTWLPTAVERGQRGPRCERIVGDTVFEEVPFRGDWSDITETGLYYVCCTGSHYRYYDAEMGKAFGIERLDDGDPALRFDFCSSSSDSGCQKE